MQRIVSIASLALMLVACSSDVKQALENARSKDNPAEALTIVRQAEEAYLERCNSLRCDVPDELHAAEREYFIKAARAGDERVLRELFAERLMLIELKDELKNDVLSRAQGSKSVDLLVAAASISGDDKLGIVNKAQEMQYLKQAWAAGDAKSAGKLAHIYVRLKDFDNAYFWSLRCIQDCVRHDGVKPGESLNQIELNELEKLLDTSRIAKLQNESALKTLPQ